MNSAAFRLPAPMRQFGEAAAAIAVVMLLAGCGGESNDPSYAELDEGVSVDEKLAAIGPEVRHLDLSGADVTDAHLEKISSMDHVTELLLPNTQITDAGLATIAKMNQLEYLDVSNTQITDAGLVHLHGLTNLKYLYLNGTQVTPKGLKPLYAALSGTTISQ